MMIVTFKQLPFNLSFAIPHTHKKLNAFTSGAPINNSDGGDGGGEDDGVKETRQFESSASSNISFELFSNQTCSKKTNLLL